VTIETTTGHETVVDVQGVATHVRRAGSGRPMLFLHGAFFPTRWLPFPERLAQRSDLVAPVLPGYAEGGPPDWLRGFDDLVLYARALLDTLQLGRADVVGFDLGGWVAGTFAAYYPDRVRSLTVIAPTGLHVPEAPAMEWLAADPERVADALFNGDPGPHRELLANGSDIDAFVEAYGENGVTARLIWERRYDIRLARRLSYLTMPTHVLTPAEDRVVPPRHAERWAEIIPGATLTRLGGVGHAAIVQDPGAVADRVLAFVEEVMP